MYPTTAGQKMFLYRAADSSLNNLDSLHNIELQAKQFLSKFLSEDYSTVV